MKSLSYLFIIILISCNNFPDVKSISNIQVTSATAEGTIEKIGSAYKVDRGFVIDTIANQGSRGKMIFCGSGEGDFKAKITGLIGGKTYYVGAFVILYYEKNSKPKYIFGHQASFKTLDPDLPTIITTPLDDYSTGGEIINDGGAPIIARGICYSTIINPTILDKIVFDEESHGYLEKYDGKRFSMYFPINNFDSIYFIRAFATNSKGTSYGNNIIRGLRDFVCSGKGWEIAPLYNPQKKGIHPLIFFDDLNDPGSFISIPTAWYPNSPTLVELIACETVKEMFRKPCYYEGGIKIDRFSLQYDLTIREAKSANIIAKKTFYSREPDPCSNSIYFKESDLTFNAKYGTIDEGIINSWIEKFVVK